MKSHSVAMLGTGLIGDFYTRTLHGQRGRDRVATVYSRSEERGKAFSERWDIPHHTTSLREAASHPEVDTVVVGLPNFMHEEPIAMAAEAGMTSTGDRSPFEIAPESSTAERYATSSLPMISSCAQTNEVGLKPNTGGHGKRLQGRWETR